MKTKHTNILAVNKSNKNGGIILSVAKIPTTCL